ncbi:hypothetical protein VST7929_02040 [Vibrio stylophorae]|uniref:Flagella basal body P-ring formation protein FlgA n=1 Tax=Vibrio stylophorae TaxID=659351 RepID=A0ABM8ZUY8_9VIBR|nr:flagellar basal body P-ring formation chaperone FlgA [Vibrio stylophorae]CAH0534139.1 hypothetical protein VST7929_02040 [Vibrio stylophorae]
MIQRTTHSSGNKVTSLFRFIGIISLCLSFNLHAATQSQIDAVRSAALETVYGQVAEPEHGELALEANRIDSRLKLTHCPEPLITSIPGSQNIQSNVTVLVRCEPDNWQVYVPVRVKVLVPMVVATRPLARGAMITAADLDLQMLDSRHIRGHIYTDARQIIGSRIKRNVGMGQAVQSNDICVVCRNDTVIITAQGGGLSVIAKGTALSDGTEGEEVRVRNSKSRRIIDGVVTGVGEVRVLF